MTLLIKDPSIEDSNAEENFRVSTGVDTLKINDTAKTLVPNGTATTSLSIGAGSPVSCFYVSSVEGGNFTVISAGGQIKDSLDSNLTDISFTSGEYVLFQQESTNSWTYKVIGEGSQFIPISFSINSNSSTSPHVTFTGEIEIDDSSQVLGIGVTSTTWQYLTSSSGGWVTPTSGSLPDLAQWISDNIGPTDDFAIRPIPIMSGSGKDSVGFDYKILYR